MTGQPSQPTISEAYAKVARSLRAVNASFGGVTESRARLTEDIWRTRPWVLIGGYTLLLAINVAVLVLVLLGVLR